MKLRSSILLALFAAFGVSAQAEVIIYVKDPAGLAVGPSNPSIYLNGDSYFDVFIRTDVALNGVSLDVELRGPAVQITSALVQNPNAGANDRWTAVFPGSVAANGRSAISFDGYALTPAPGINPATKASDAGYSLVDDAYHFARINYQQVGVEPTPIFFRVGGNEVGFVADPPNPRVRFGVGDPPPCNIGLCDSNPVADGIFFVPEPAGACLAIAAMLGLLGVYRRRESLVA